MVDISYIRNKIGRLFSVLNDSDYDHVRKALQDVEDVLKKYLTGGA